MPAAWRASSLEDRCISNGRACRVCCPKISCRPEGPWNSTWDLFRDNYRVQPMSRHKPPEDGSVGITASFLSLRSGLHKFLLRFLVRRQDVEDIVQETFLRAYESARQQTIDFPKSFLFTVAKNLALSEIERKASRMTFYVSDLQELNVADEQCVEDKVDAQQKLAALLKVVATLPPQCQRVVILKKMLGFSHHEIGRRLDISVRTVEKHLAKALRRCQESLQPERRVAEALQCCQESPPAARTPSADSVKEWPQRKKLLAVRGRRE
jgi:RNA polymerase sigma factor (sigma-70 family)